ncbi:hypothetical protein NDU88_000422 [Pleurodeles waltl]|uniref:Uncharacterized protein n=1 Tax=Pleurodeles waltl TaxID=8319 RepID=A0AAV7WFH4_PLEWA|nr:hypothetical protein NDU88_000422 [Pleurodeles waltl]
MRDSAKLGDSVMSSATCGCVTPVPPTYRTSDTPSPPHVQFPVLNIADYYHLRDSAKVGGLGAEQLYMWLRHACPSNIPSRQTPPHLHMCHCGIEYGAFSLLA